VELQLLVQAARRSILLLLVCVLAGAALGVAAWRLLPASYQASAVLVMDSTAVTVPGQEPFSGDPERYVTGELESLRSYSAAAAAGQAVEPALTPREVLDALQLSHVTGSDVVTLSVRADTPTAAIALANAVADTYVSRRDEAAQSALTEQRDALEEQAAQLAGQLSLQTPTDSLSAALGARYAEVTGDLADLSRPGVLRDGTRVVDEARDAPFVRAVPLLPAALGGAALGGLVGLLIAAVGVARRPAVSGTWQVEELTGRPVEAVFPRARRGRARTGQAVAASARRMVALMELDGGGPRPVVVSVCDAGGHPGRSAVFAALATRLAEEGRRVVAVSPERAEVTVSTSPEGPVPLDGVQGWRSETATRANLTLVSHPAPEGVDADDLVKALPEWSAGTDVVLVDAGSLPDSSFALAALRASSRSVLVVPVGGQSVSDLRLAVDVLETAGDARRHVVVTSP